MASKNKNPIVRFFANIITSGKSTEDGKIGMSDYLFRYKLMNSLLLFGLFPFVFFTVLSLTYREYNFAAICFSMALLFFVSFVLARTNVRQIIPASISMICYGAFCFFITLIDYEVGWGFVHIFVYPLMTIMLLGLQLGVALSAMLLCAMSVLRINKIAFGYFIHMFSAYIIILIVMIVIEMNRKNKDQIIESQAAELKNFDDNLQKMVEEKTENVLDLQNTLLKTMAELVEFRDDITGGHIERTQGGIKIFLEEIEKEGLYDQETKGWDHKLLLQSCQLHDVGKIAISDGVLKKPGKLTTEEFE